MEKKKVFIRILFLLCIILFVRYYFSEDAILERRGKRNAIQYIVEKYDFIPRVKEVRCEFVITDLFPFNSHNTGYVWVDMTYKKQDFKVYISGEERTKDGRDNYQTKIIEQAISDEVHKYVTNINEVICPRQYFTEYYNGTNLSEVLGACDTNLIKVITTESGLDKVTENSMKNSFGDNIEFLFVDFKEKTIDMSKYKDKNLFSESVFEDFISDNELYLNEVKYCRMDNHSKQNEMISLNYTDGQKDVFKYRYENGTYCNFKKIEPEYFNEWIKDFEYSKDAPKAAYDIYSIDTDASKVIIMFPYDEFKDENIIYIKPRFYYEKISDGTKNRHGISSIMDDEKCLLTSFETEDAKNIMFTVINWR